MYTKKKAPKGQTSINTYFNEIVTHENIKYIVQRNFESFFDNSTNTKVYNYPFISTSQDNQWVYQLLKVNVYSKTYALSNCDYYVKTE